MMESILQVFAAQRRLEHAQRLKQNKPGSPAAIHAGYTEDGSPVVRLSNGGQYRSRVITNGSLGLTDRVEITKSPGSRLCFADKRNR